MWRWLAMLTSPRTGFRSLRAVATSDGDPYRSHLGSLPTERLAEPRPLAAVCTAVREAGHDVVSGRRGFELIGPTHDRAMLVRVRDPHAVTPEALACGAEAPELLLDLALALVPLFGPLVAEVRFAGPILVDGTRDRGTIGEEAAHRIQQVGARFVLRAPASFLHLRALALRMRRHS